MSRPLERQHPVHFIGVGGIGMSALARILVDRGHPVSGSDPRDTPTSRQLTQLGVTVFHQQTAGTIETLLNDGHRPIVVISTAIPASNPELSRARAAGLDVWHRSDLLAALIDQQPSIAVAGSHGKTTTSTLITTLLIEAGEDPTAIIGGIVPCLESNGHAGHGRLLVAEADESDGSLVKFRAHLGLITNLELDHTDHYSNLNDLVSTMRRFAGAAPGLANKDCPVIRGTLPADAWWSVTEANGVTPPYRSNSTAIAAMPASTNRRTCRGLRAAPARIAQPQQRGGRPGSLRMEKFPSTTGGGTLRRNPRPPI